MCIRDSSYQSALDALGYRAIVGSGGVIYINDVEPVNRGKLQFDQQEESDLVADVYKRQVLRAWCVLCWE